jgi:hypothetical protein
MPERKTIRRAHEKKREGKAPSTQASEFVREQMHHLEEGKGPRSRRQAIAIGLSEAREAGVPIPSRRRKSTRSRAASKSEQLHTGARSGQKRTAQSRSGARKTSRPKRATTERQSTAERAPARRTRSPKAASKPRSSSTRRSRAARSA